MIDPATRKRGGDPDARPTSAGAASATDASDEERELEQGLEESMAGSDPVSVTQPHRPHDAVTGSPPERKPPRDQP